jgi:hypothetical protein
MGNPVSQPKTIDSPGIVTSNPAVCTGVLIGMDGVNDITDLTAYANNAASGPEVLPTNPYEADYKGLNGALNMRVICNDGIYVDWTSAGSVEVTVHFYETGNN